MIVKRVTINFKGVHFLAHCFNNVGAIRLINVVVEEVVRAHVNVDCQILHVTFLRLLVDTLDARSLIIAPYQFYRNELTAARRI